MTKDRFQNIRKGLAAAFAAAGAVTLTWYGGWVALEAVSVASALLLTAWSLWLLRQDRSADYQRSLVPWVTVRVGNYDASYQYVPLEVSALGHGTAYNVIVNLFHKHPQTHAFDVAEPVVPQLAAGERKEMRLRMVSGPFAGQLEVGYFDPAGRRHIAWHSVTTGSGTLSTTDPLNWICPHGCVVHPRGKQRL